jgi:tetratricopeptide (TPR) repeat protein
VGKPVREIRLRLSGPAEPTAKRLAAQDGAPERIYIDVPAQIDPAVQRTLTGTGAVRQVRTGQRDTTTARVVVELAAVTPFTMTTKGRVATLRLGTPEKNAQPVAAASPAAVAAAPVPKTAVLASAQVVTAAAEAPPAPVEAPSMSSVAPPPQLAATPFQVLRGVRFLPPALETPLYADEASASLRDALGRWQSDGTIPDAPLPGMPASAATAHLAADVLLVRAVNGQDDPLAAIAAYERAARDFPHFGDAPRAQLMAGMVALWLELGPEASSAFGLFLDRFQSHALAPYARVAQATALRLRHRTKEAKRALVAVLSSAEGDVRCEARLEEARQARDGGTPAQAATLFRGLASECPQTMMMPSVLGDEAAALAAAGARTEARQLLAAPRPSRGVEEDAALDLLAGTLAQDDQDLDGARMAYERVLRRRASRKVISETEMRIAVLDGGKNAAGRLQHLATESGTPAVRAALLLEASRTQTQAGNFEAALAILDDASRLDPPSERQADAERTIVLRTWVAKLAAAEDWAGIATVYAAYTTNIHRLATADDRLVIAGAFERLGVPAMAATVMQVRVTSADPPARIAYAEVALRADDVPGARGATAKLEPRALDPALAARLGQVRARIALADGDLAGAATGLAAYPDPALADEVGRAEIVAGDTATASGAWDEAIATYRRALVGPGSPPVRTAAAAALARVALARGDGALAAVALDEVGAGGSPLARRVAAALVAKVPAPAVPMSAPVDVEEASDGH